MRESLFKGFYKDCDEEEKIFFNGEWIKGKWVYGGTWKNERKQRFVTEDNGYYGYSVIPETVGQKINSVEWYWEDENESGYESEVWTGDVVKIYFGYGEYHICYLDIEYGDLILIGDTLPDGFVWVNELNSVHNQNLITDIVEDIDGIRSIRAELLGNRFDNTEILKG